LLQKTLQALSSDGRADRIGVWIESPDADEIKRQGTPSFRGLVWDREDRDVPPEWGNLSPDTPLPQALLAAGRSVEQELEHGALPLIGPLLELRRAIWVPIERRGRLRGVLLAGSRSRHGDLPKEVFESAAAELALVMELEEEQKLDGERQSDLRLVKETLASEGGQQSALTLGELVENCTADAQFGHGLGATFAAIGAVPPECKNPDEPAAAFHWTSGDSVCINGIENAPAAEIWRRAMETGRIMGAEHDAASISERIRRIVAIPLVTQEKIIGVLIAGLGPQAASPADVERLELRAALAAVALDAWQRNQEDTREAAWRKALLEANAEATLLLDAQGRIVDASVGARRLLSEHRGRENAGPQIGNTGQRLKELFQASDQRRIDAWSARALLGMEDRRSERRSGPSEVPEGMLSNGIRVRLRSAIPAGGRYAAVTLDTWKDSGAVQEDLRAHAELDGILEWLDEGVILFDAQDNVRAINSRFLQIIGLRSGDAADLATLERLIFKLSEHVADPWHFSQRWRNLARGIDGGIREELEFLHPTPRIVQRLARPILDAEGRRLGRVEIYRDLTIRRGSQSKLLRTEKLAALGQLITTVVHELNNPLTSILGYSQRLLENAQTAAIERELRHIFQEAERATSILKQLLLNAHESKLELRIVSINQIVRQAIELQQVSLAQEKISVLLDLDPAWPMVHGDAGQLQQVLMNLTGNARQALDQTGRGGTIRIRTKQIGAQRVLLEIADDGPGISQEILGRIFDPFFTTKPAGTGTGLGLAIVLGIVREHGGHVNVASPPKGGAIFSIALRAASGATRAGIPEEIGKSFSPSFSQTGVAAATSSAPATDSIRPSRENMLSPATNRILVVEDEPTVARLIADVLEDEGFRVDVVLDGREALKQATRESYDLVICDMKMPGIDGRQFYRALAQAGNSLSDRFLFVTGDTVSLHTHEFLEGHGLPHVAKPFRMEELKDRVHDLLNREGSRVSKVSGARKNA
jgi:signal transduction histidine kinase/CheY-like chemotaxis protein